MRSESDQPEQEMRQALARVFAEEQRWSAVIAYRPDDDDPFADRTPADEHRFIYDFAMFPDSDSDDAPWRVIDELATPSSLYDMVGVLCRELIRLRVELGEMLPAPPPPGLS